MFRFLDTDSLKDGEIVLRLTSAADAKPEKEYLPAYYFDICSPAGERMGTCDLRVGHNRKTYVGGNIGYQIFEPYRGHHYAAKACALPFQLAKRHGMEYLIITCVPENAASARTCEIAGGKLLETAPVPAFSELYAEGKCFVRVYRFEL